MSTFQSTVERLRETMANTKDYPVGRVYPMVATDISIILSEIPAHEERIRSLALKDAADAVRKVGNAPRGFSFMESIEEIEKLRKPEEYPLPIVIAMHTTNGKSWEVTVEAVEALRGLVLFTNQNGDRCFCDQWKDPAGLSHSGACLRAQDVLRRADTL